MIQADWGDSATQEDSVEISPSALKMDSEEAGDSGERLSRMPEEKELQG